MRIRCVKTKNAPPRKPDPDRKPNWLIAIEVIFFFIVTMVAAGIFIYTLIFHTPFDRILAIIAGLAFLLSQGFKVTLDTIIKWLQRLQTIRNAIDTVAGPEVNEEIPDSIEDAEKNKVENASENDADD